MSLRRRCAPIAVKLLAFCALTVPLLGGTIGCSGGQKTDGPSGEVSVKLRRVDVVSSSLDTMTLAVLVAVHNGTNASVTVSGGEATVSVLGPAATMAEEGETNDIDGESEDGEQADAVERTEESEADEASETSDDEEGESDGEEESKGIASMAPQAPVDTDPTGIVTGEELMGTLSKGMAVAAQSEELASYIVTLPLPKEAAVLERLMSWERVKLAVSGSVEVGGRTETYKSKREIAVPSMPVVRLLESQVASVDGGREGVAFFRIAIENPNIFEMNVDKFAWGITVGGKELLAVPTGEREVVPPSSLAEYEDSVKLNVETFGPQVRKLLAQPRIPYRLNGYIEVHGIRHPVLFEGEMNFAR